MGFYDVDSASLFAFSLYYDACQCQNVGQTRLYWKIQPVRFAVLRPVPRTAVCEWNASERTTADGGALAPARSWVRRVPKHRYRENPRTGQHNQRGAAN